MKNWKKLLLFFFVVFVLLILNRNFDVPIFFYDSKEKQVDSVTQSRFSEIPKETMKYDDQFQSLKIETLLASNLENPRILKSSDSFKVNYRGWLAKNGEIFDSSVVENPNQSQVVFKTSNLITGFTQGVLGMKVGEIRRVLIPYNMGYGEAGTQNIPPNSDLVFDIELLQIL